jgi:hypothetical protein
VRWSKNTSASDLVGDTFRPSHRMAPTAHATAVSASLCVSYHPRPGLIVTHKLSSRCELLGVSCKL